MARMRRMWLPFTQGATTSTLAGAGEFRVDIASLMAAEQGRDVDHYTVTRVIFNLFLEGASAHPIVSVGIKSTHEDVTVGNITPDLDVQVDWVYHEEFAAGNPANAPREQIHRDVRGMRKVLGFEQNLFFHISNRDASIVLTHHVSGRCLVLVP